MCSVHGEGLILTPLCSRVRVLITGGETSSMSQPRSPTRNAKKLSGREDNSAAYPRWQPGSGALCPHLASYLERMPPPQVIISPDLGLLSPWGHLGKSTAGHRVSPVTWAQYGSVCPRVMVPNRKATRDHLGMGAVGKACGVWDGILGADVGAAQCPGAADLPVSPAGMSLCLPSSCCCFCV